jgi:hypothetical protein
MILQSIMKAVWVGRAMIVEVGMVLSSKAMSSLLSHPERVRDSKEACTAGFRFSEARAKRPETPKIL